MKIALNVVLWCGTALAVTNGAWAQSSEPTPVTVYDVLAGGAGVGVFLLPSVLDWNDGPPPCAPCARNGVPAFDRWSIRVPDSTVSRVSDVVLIAMAFAGWADLATEGRSGRAAVVASMQSAVWAEAVTRIIKDVVGRERPVLYTPAAPAAAAAPSNQRSLPSGHAAGAFALATSYWLSRRGVVDDRPWVRWVLLAGATGVGALRVAAGNHFPSDVVVGAAVGVGTALVVHHIKF